MIKGIGIDIVGISDFRKSGNNPYFIGQILTPPEISGLPADGRKEVYTATLFALKEAVLKALGCGLSRGFYWQEINIEANSRVRLTGRLLETADKMEIGKIHCSHSHSENFIAAFVLLEN